MSQKEWLLNQIKEYETRVHTYEEKSFFQELLLVVTEQYKRIEQAEGELDGSLWSPKKW